MPRKMRAPKLRRTVQRLRDLPLDAVMSLELPWAPGATRGPWQDWAEYLAMYETVRDELLASLADHQHPPARVPWAERVWAFRERYGAAVLAVSSYEDIRDHVAPEGR